MGVSSAIRRWNLTDLQAHTTLTTGTTLDAYGFACEESPIHTPVVNIGMDGSFLRERHGSGAN